MFTQKEFVGPQKKWGEGEGSIPSLKKNVGAIP
jgi:hypothetical protein